MSLFLEILAICATILASLGGGAAILFALSKWLGGVWANRILENEKASLAREHELLVRRRDIYAKLALAMRVFVDSGIPPTNKEKVAFLTAYDEAALWSSEEVINELGEFLDLLSQINLFQAQTDSIAFNQEELLRLQKALKPKFLNCISVMRQDCGFPKSDYLHRIVTF